jgi:diguanylate cyclase
MTATTVDTQARSARVLLVEDDPVTAELHSELLVANGAAIAVTRAESLADACAALTEAAPDCVVLDLGLPDADGLEAVREIERFAPSVAIVVLTGRDDDELALEAVKLGAQDYLNKGRIDGDAMRRAIRHAVERKRSEAALAHLALHDPLTGLPNRTLLFDRLRLALTRLQRDGGGVALLFADLNHFKAINDTAGHAAGDAALRAAADAWSHALRSIDVLSRYGGDEFAVLLPNCDLAQAEEVLDRMRASTPSGLGASIGVTEWQARETPEDLVGRADTALYASKRAGRNRTTAFEPGAEDGPRVLRRVG